MFVMILSRMSTALSLQWVDTSRDTAWIKHKSLKSSSRLEIQSAGRVDGKGWVVIKRLVCTIGRNIKKHPDVSILAREPKGLGISEAEVKSQAGSCFPKRRF